jgi:hypothetical protein
MVPTEDYRCYLDNVEDKSFTTYAKLKEVFKVKDFAATNSAHHNLVESLPTAIGAYCYRRVSESFTFKVEEFNKRPDLDEMKETYKEHLNVGQLHELSYHFYFVSMGKGSNRIDSLIKNKFLEMIQLLCDPEYRRFLKIPDENRYIFASTRTRNAMGYPNPSKCQCKFAEQVKDRVPRYKELRSRHFRMTFSTNLGLMNLTYTSKKHLCAVLGHTLEVHERAYNMPQPLQVACTMGFALRASSDDRVRSLKALSIESQLDMHIEDISPPEGEEDM